MAFDLAISDPGDLIVSAARDLQGVSGSQLLDQRIRLRLKLHRGSWIYDTAETLGSTVYTLLGKNPEQYTAQVEAHVRQALLPIEEIVVSRVDAEYEPATGVTVTIRYRVKIDGVADNTENEVSVGFSSEARAVTSGD